MKWRYTIGLLFLGLQLLGIAAARFTTERYFCWAPYDEITVYKLEVNVGGRTLTPKEIKQRYRFAKAGRDNRCSTHVMRVIEQYESGRGAKDGATVAMQYRVNGGEPRSWQWPPQTQAPLSQ
jgi:hypothetical protein